MKIRINLYAVPALGFTAGILAGTALGICCRKPMLDMVRQYLPLIKAEADSIKESGIYYWNFIFMLRLPLLVILMAVLFTGFYACVYGLLSLYTGMSMALLIMAGTLYRGPLGLLYALLLQFPQCFFYLFGYWAMFELAIKKSSFSSWEQAQILLKTAAVFLVGIMTEAFASPFVFSIVVTHALLA